ncbi:MAG: hypothetical protein JNN07_14985 [Verrucomicrobiales bacterium]|nr:hypothetical protein [Verrucomicrobiales bacterium]
MKYNKTIVLSTAAMLAFVSPSFAKNITINDTQTQNSASWGAGGKGLGEEDQETEVGTLGNQSWDLEAFTLNGHSLKIYSGYDLLNGNDPYGLGDIFIGRGNVAKYKSSDYTGTDGQINGINNNSQFKYDYVIHFNNRSGTTIGGGSYDVYQLSGLSSELLDETVFKGLSNPYKLNTERSQGLVKVGSGIMTVVEDSTATLTLEDGTQVTGGKHYIGEVDLLSSGVKLSQTDDNLFHLTMACGNDSLVGRVPDGGATLSLLGFAVSGLSLLSRRVSRKS